MNYICKLLHCQFGEQILVKRLNTPEKTDRLILLTQGKIQDG